MAVWIPQYILDQAKAMEEGNEDGGDSGDGDDDDEVSNALYLWLRICYFLISPGGERDMIYGALFSKDLPLFTS